METTESIGRCVLCKIEGQGEKDFICERCGSPDKVILACQCGQRADVMLVEKRTMEFFFQRFFKGIDRSSWTIPDMRLAGAVILVRVCGNCINKKESGPLGETAVYKIRKS